MELTRRDALAALAAGGVAAAGGCAAPRAFDAASTDDGPSAGDGPNAGPVELSSNEIETLVTVARAVYPSEVSGIETFVETYSRGRIETVQDDAYRRGVVEAIETFDARARSWYDAPFLDLEPATREQLLREVGSDTPEPDPTGTDAERVRHFLVNEVLFALYVSPTGGELVGIENP